MRVACASFLLAAAVAAQDEKKELELELKDDPVVSKSIGCEIGVPAGWKVVKDRTGLSVRGPEGGYVVSREPFLGDEKTFEKKWKDVLARAGIAAEVDNVRAGRYRAFTASWPSRTADDRVVKVFRIHAEDLQMLYNVAFSMKSDLDTEDFVEDVLRSFRVTEEERDLEFEKAPIDVGQAGKMRIPKGCAETKVGGFQPQTIYRKILTGYEKPKLALEIRAESVRTRARIMQTGGNSSNPEDLIRYARVRFGLQDAQWEDEPRTRGASHGRTRGEALTGRIRKDGEILEVYLWCGKGDNHAPMILVVAHERELRLHRRLFREILRTYEPRK